MADYLVTVAVTIKVECDTESQAREARNLGLSIVTEAVARSPRIVESDQVVTGVKIAVKSYPQSQMKTSR